MGNRYADDIRRIVGIDPNQSKLGDPDRKPAIPGKRGIAWRDQGSNNINSLSGRSSSDGGTQLTNTASRNGIGVSGAAGISGAGGGSNAEGSGVRDPNDPTAGAVSDADLYTPVENIIDGTADQSKLQTPTPTFNGLGYQNGSGLNGVSAYDCDNSKGVNIKTRQDIDFPPPQATLDAEGNEITAAWTDANTPPTKPNYEAGIYWTVLVSGVENDEYATPQEAAAAYVSYHNANTANPPSIPERQFSGITSLGSGTGGWSFEVTTIEVTPQTIELNGQRNDCVGDAPNDPNACPIVPPTEEFWPEGDGSYQLEYREGKLTSNQYDPNVPTEHKQPISSVKEFCFGDSNSRTGAVEPTAQGGQMIYETDGGSPTGTVRVYDSNGQLTGAFDASSTESFSLYRPTDQQ